MSRCSLRITIPLFISVFFLVLATNLNAQSNLLVSASSIEFLAPDTQHQPGQQTLFITSAGAPLQYEARIGYSSTAKNWLSITPVYGATPVTLALVADPTDLADGIHLGTVEIAYGGAQPSVVYVALRIGHSAVTEPLAARQTLSSSRLPDGPGTEGFTRFPQSLTFNHQIGTAPPQPQMVRVSSAGASRGFVASSSANWLTVSSSPAKAANRTAERPGDGALFAYANPNGLSPGQYSASITLRGPGGETESLPVTLNIGEGPFLVALPNALTIDAPGGQSAAVPQTITIASTSGDLGYTASADSGPLLAIGPRHGSTLGANTLTIAVNPEELLNGARNGSITVTAPGAANTLTIPVETGLKPRTTGLSFSADPVVIQGTFPGVPQSTTVTLTSSLGAESFNVGTLSSCQCISVSPTSGTTPATLTVTGDPSVLPGPGTYTGFLDAGAPSGEALTHVNFVVTAGSNAVITANPSSLTFTVPLGSTTPVQMPVQLTSSPATSFTATPGASFIGVSPTGGSTPATLTVTVAASKSAIAGSYPSMITVTGGSSPLNIPVTLNITASQTNTIGATPTSLSFSQTIGGATPSSQTVQVSATTSTSFTASSDATWLTVSPTSGASTPATLTVSVNASGLNASASPYNGHITVTGGGSTATVSITFTLSSPSSSTITFTPSAITFAQTLGGAAPPAQTVQLSSSPAASFTAVPNATWLLVTPTSGATPATLTLTVNASGLAAQTYQTTVTVTGGGGTVQIPVTLNLGGTNPITVAPTALFFTLQSAAAASQQTLQLTSPTAIAFTVASDSTWLTASPTSGNTPATVTVTANPAGLNVGIYNGNITISGGSSPVIVPVSLVVSSGTAGTITATPSAVSFAAVVGSNAFLLGGVQLQGTTPTNFTATSGATWLNVSPMVGTTPASLALTVTPAGMAIGTYATSVQVLGGATPVTIPVQLIVSSSTAGTISAAPASLTFTQSVTGAPAPPQNLQLTSTPTASFTASSGAPWLTVTSSSTTTPATLTLSVSTTGLAPGTYQTTVGINGGTNPVSIPVTFMLSSSTAPAIAASPASAGFSLQLDGTTSPQTVQLSSATATSFVVSSGASWLTVSPASGTTPASLNLSVNGSSLTDGSYQTLVTIDGASQTTVPVTITVFGGVAGAITFSPSTVSFSQQLGTAAPASQTVPLTSTSTTNFTASSGAPWLTVSPTSGTTPGSVALSASAAGLTPGSYQTSVTITGGTSVVAIPVSFTVTAATVTALVASPTSLSFSATAGGQSPAMQTISVTSSGTQIAYSLTATAASGGTWLSVTPATGTTPGSLTVSATPTGLAAGQYTGGVTITPSDTTLAPLTVPVTLTISAGATSSAVVSAIVSAASLQSGPISPGEIITIFGSGLGPMIGVVPTALASGAFGTSLGGTTVLFDGGSAAPLLYVGANQINAVVPYEITGRLGTNVQIQIAGVLSAPIDMAVMNTAPAIFTLTGNGLGQGAIQNQDYTTNSPSFPTARGSIVMIYATGEGQTAPPGQDGRIISTDLRTPVAPVSVTIGGQPALVNYAGSAPGAVSGLMQINAVVPSNVTPGGAVPVVIQVGGVNSQTGVTMAVK